MFAPFGTAGCTAPLAFAFETLAVISAFETGQKPPLCFFLAGPTPSPFVEWAKSLADVTVEVEEVEDAEALDANDEEELLLVATFFCGMNIRETSSELIAEKPA